MPTDFFGDEIADDPLGRNTTQQAPALTPEQMAEDRRRKEEWLRNQGLDANGNPLPAYGTPQSQGGTATGFQVVKQPTIGTGAMSQIQTTQLGPRDVPLIGGMTREDITQVHGAGTNGGTTPILRQTTAGRTTASQAGLGGAGGGGAMTDQTAQGTQLLQDDLERRQQGSTDQMNFATGNMGSPLDNPLATQQAANQAGAALGPAPKISGTETDRQLGAVEDSIGMQRTVYDQLLNGPNTTERLGSQVLRNQLALARSAAGGPGAVQEAMRHAQDAAPELQAAAAQAATAETLQRLNAAGGVAQGVGQTALSGRGQDVQVAAQNQQAATALMQSVGQLTGQQLQLDQQNQELLGQMARDLAAQNFNWGQLNAQQQQAEFDRWVKTYGIDANIAAQLAIAAKASDKGIMDYAIPIIGSLAQLGAAAL